MGSCMVTWVGRAGRGRCLTRRVTHPGPFAARDPILNNIPRPSRKKGGDALELQNTNHLKSHVRSTIQKQPRRAIVADPNFNAAG